MRGEAAIQRTNGSGVTYAERNASIEASFEEQ